MYVKEILGLEEAKTAVEAMLAQALKTPEQPVAMVVVDNAGLLIYYAKMDGANWFSQMMAIRKASSVVQTRVDTQAFAAGLNMISMDLGDLGSTDITTVPGGVVANKPDSGNVLGGIGVSGYLLPQMDESLARVGLAALSL